VRRLALLAIFATACGSTPASGQALALVFHTGDVYRYSFVSNGHLAIDPSPPDPVQKTAHLAYTVMSVDSSGTADLSLETSDAAVTSTEGAVTPPVGTSLNGTSELKVRSNGSLLSVTVNSTAFGGGTWWAVLSGKAARAGDTWSTDFDVSYPGYSISGHFKTKSKYLRDESFHGANAAVIESTFATTTTAPATPGSAISVAETSTSTITTWIDRTAGRVLKSHLTLSYVGTFTDLSGSTPPTTVRGDEISDLLPG
jgi:hypothetical protein